eukprot:scaffold18138_cov128-Cylindrotheca_fusiformis.AAC.20
MKDEEFIKEYDPDALWNTEEEYVAYRSKAKKTRAFVLLLALIVFGVIVGSLLGSEGLGKKSSRSIQSPPGGGEEQPTAAPEVLGGEIIVTDPEEEDPAADVDIEALMVYFNSTIFYSNIVFRRLPTTEWNATMFVESDEESNIIVMTEDGFELQRSEDGNLTTVYEGTYLHESNTSIALEIPVDLFADLPNSEVWVISGGDRVPDEDSGGAEFELDYATSSPTAPGETRAPSDPAAPPSGTVPPGTPTMSPTAPGETRAPSDASPPTGTVAPGTPTVRPTRTPTVAPTRSSAGNPTGTVSPGTPTATPTKAPTVAPTRASAGNPTGTASPGTPTAAPTTSSAGNPTGTAAPGTPTVAPTTSSGGNPTGTVSPGTPTVAPTTSS